MSGMKVLYSYNGEMTVDAVTSAYFYDSFEYDRKVFGGLLIEVYEGDDLVFPMTLAQANACIERLFEDGRLNLSKSEFLYEDSDGNLYDPSEM